jgi:SAM-dependent methyltransferase
MTCPRKLPKSARGNELKPRRDPLVADEEKCAGLRLICLLQILGGYAKWRHPDLSVNCLPGKIMGDYTNMSVYYDLIMRSGYYDYDKIVDNLVQHLPFSQVLEIGCGTGLILETLAKRQPSLALTGVDLTQAMLSIAQQRLQNFPQVTLQHQNVTELHLKQTYDLAFSYGGVWYFVIDGDTEPFLVSHIAQEEPNRQGLSKVGQHVKAGGQLLLGVQGPHHDYSSPISNGMLYSQKIEPADHGFIKHYYLADGDTTLMAQTIHYRTYPFAEALELLQGFGFTYQPYPGDKPQFLKFKKT